MAASVSVYQRDSIFNSENSNHLISTFSPSQLYSLKNDILTDPNTCHFFYTVAHQHIRLLSELLERNTFSTHVPSIADRFVVSVIELNKTVLIWASFPIEFKETCIKAADFLGLKQSSLSEYSFTILNPQTRYTEQYKFPDAPNILFFEQKQPRDISQQATEEEQDFFRRTFASLDQLGID